jgi:hypothetical protein
MVFVRTLLCVTEATGVDFGVLNQLLCFFPIWLSSHICEILTVMFLIIS